MFHFKFIKNKSKKFKRYLYSKYKNKSKYIIYLYKI